MINESNLRIFASEKSWIEGDAVQQLRYTLTLPGMVYGVGLPDLHPGKGHAIGAAFISVGNIYPFLVGSDIGCGIGLWTTGIKISKVKRDKWGAKLVALEEQWDGDPAAWLAAHGVPTPTWESSLGSIGAGNHFAELQMIDKVEDTEVLESLGLSKDRLVLAVHSGSRGLGDWILRSHTSIHGAKGLEVISAEATVYLGRHNDAMRWAAANRALIAARILDIIGGDGDRVLDLCHNSVTQCTFDGGEGWLHRKGAAPSDQGPLLIPGSRGAYSYLVVPVGDQTSNAWSLAHGAGRKWNRSAIKARLKGQVSLDSLRQTKLGSLVICDNKDLLLEEAPEAYKNIDTVINDLAEPGLLKVVARLKPVITYKTADPDRDRG